ncbi:NAD(P)H-binding protein [Variovorax sp. LT2P21]|uniref:NAD(P)H-binding protein n=1 Tax=Variovorax sp. LT2P21 TaxID=3443731 RepID=UPI003F460295
MKVLIFGATGASGLLTVRSALKHGHDVTVYARNPAKLGNAITDARLKIFQGELTDAAAIDTAIAGQDAVVSVLGPTKGASGTPLTDGFRAILGAMERHRVRRLVATSTPAFRQPEDRFVLSFWLGVSMIRVMVAPAYRDIVGSAEAISASRLDWTIVRLPMLTDKPHGGPPVAGPLGTPGLRLFSLSREVLADFLIDQLTDDRWTRRAPVISN